MNYFKLADDRTSNGRWHIAEIVLTDGTEPDLVRGGPLKNSEPLHADFHYTGHALEFCLTSLWVPLATRALADTIQSIAKSDVQCLPLAISGQSDMVVLNALRYIGCINESHSEFIKWTTHDHRADLAGKFRQVTKLVLARDAIPPDAHFFRIKDWEVALIVSETVKSAMERVGCYGAEFVELELA